MSKFLSDKFSAIEPYVPGEQPKDFKYVKLNTNESPFPPSPNAIKFANEKAKTLNLYSDPECTPLVKEAARLFGIGEDEIVFTNGSDDSLGFAFSAFCDEKHPAVFADITYGFYPVFATYYGVPYETIPLKDDFTINVDDYVGINKTIFIANPNAPTAIALELCDIEKIVSSNPHNIVVIDEAYVDFGAESAMSLIHKYDNLLVVRTFSKSRSMAGARLGFAVGNKEIILDLNTIRFSTNPYNINSMTMSAGIGALMDEEYTQRNIATVIENRDYTMEKLKKLGFTMTDAKANFIFAKHDKIGGRELYEELKKKGVLVRHFEKDRIRDYNRITIGTREQMDILIAKIKEILEETK